MCDHKRLKCTDNVLTCKDCGAVLPLETLAGEVAEKATTAKKKGGKGK